MIRATGWMALGAALGGCLFCGYDACIVPDDWGEGLYAVDPAPEGMVDATLEIGRDQGWLVYTDANGDTWEVVFEVYGRAFER